MVILCFSADLKNTGVPPTPHAVGVQPALRFLSTEEEKANKLLSAVYPVRPPVVRCFASGERVHREWTSSGPDVALQLTPRRVAAVLGFFADLAQDAVMKDWLGDAEGGVFWPALLALLCNTPPPQATQTHASLLGAAHSQKVATRPRFHIFILS